MEEFFSNLKEFFTKEIWEPGRGDFWGAVLSSIIIAIFLIFKNRISKTFGLLWKFGENKVIIPRALQHYKKDLDEETLRLNHSWKLDDQSLKELIVPVNVFEKDEASRINLIEFFENEAKSTKTPRILILGEAGSGKSVSLGTIARAVWQMKRKKVLLPVLITFSDIKSMRTDEEFERVIIQNLERHQFSKGKKNNRADLYVKENLYEGNILVLLDGLDEMEKKIRFETANFVNKFFQTHQDIPFVFTSRIAVWKQNPTIFNSLDFKTAYVAKFTPLEIRQFLSPWTFTNEKSADRLAMLINEKAYLRSLAVNPLILTIITFLYAQPLRVLPDNRVKFYSECIDALIEKWDYSKIIDRANQFETIDKKSILSRLAYQHIVDMHETDEDILKSKILNIIEEELKALSRPVEKREKMLMEIVQNAELLIELPPDAYKFPHRTFMEYFAANYFREKNKHEELIELYEKDKGKWQETLALFCGLNVNPAVSDTILRQLMKDFSDTADTQNPDIFVFKAMTESAKISPGVSSDILSLAEKYLADHIHPEIVEYLGYVAINPNWNHGVTAKRILLDLLNQELSDESFELILFSLVQLPDQEIKSKVMQHLDRINLQKFLVKTGNYAEEYAIKFLENIDKSRLDQIFTGIREAGEIELLFTLMMKSGNEDIKWGAAWALALASGTDVFWTSLEGIGLKDLPRPLQIRIEELYNRYTWPKPPPSNVAGQKAIFLICDYVVNLATKRNFVFNIKQSQEEIHRKLRYLISGILHERGYSFGKYSLVAGSPEATREGIVAHWKKMAGYNSMYMSMVVCFFPYWLITIGGLMQYGIANTPLFIAGLGCCLGAITFIVYFLIKNSKLYKNSKKSSTILAIFCWVSFPLFTILVPHFFNARSYVKVLSVLGFTAITITVLMIAPFPLIYKVINIVLAAIIAVITIFGCYVSALGKIIPNPEARNFLLQQK